MTTLTIIATLAAIAFCLTCRALLCVIEGDDAEDGQ